jgi:fission process protein 1
MSGEKQWAGNRDALREGSVRLLGYANEVGESFRPLVPRQVVNASYAVAGSYVVADAVWRSELPPPGRSGMVEALDTLLWQGLASVAIPGAVINRIVWAAGKLPTPVGASRAVLPTAVGLACIPFIVSPIDRGVDWFMDRCVRPMLGGKDPGKVA